MKRFREEGELDCIRLANVLMLLSRGGGAAADHTAAEHAGRVFECKTCNRQFPSFQALGGHRASHKKPRPAGDHGPQAEGRGPPAKPRVHECSICGLEFSIGQALGGHMRRHRAAAEGLPLPQLVEDKTSTAGGSTTRRRPSGDLCLGLDLNLPPEDDDVDPAPHALGISLRPPVACWLQ